MGAREAARERLLDDLRDDEEGNSTVVPTSSHMPLMETPTAVRTKLRRLSQRLSQPPPSSSSSTLPVLVWPAPSMVTVTAVYAGAAAASTGLILY